MNIKLLTVILVIIFSIPAILPLFHPGFFQSDDGEWMIIRFSAFYQTLADGQFPVRFLGRLNHEYGYPVANFLYPGFMYLGVPIRLLGFGFVDTIKIIFGISFVGSAVFCYLWLLRLFDKFSSLVGSIFYLYTPYHLFDLYKRGSVGEVLALGVLPFTLWQIERKSFIWSSVGIGFLILAHNSLALLFIPIVIVYGVVKRNNSIFYVLYSIFLGLGLSAFFWIPAIFELQYTVFSKTQVSNWQEYFSDFGLVGLSTIVIFAFYFFLHIKNRNFFNTIKYWRNVSIFFFLLGLVSLFLATKLSNFVWELIPVSFVQFPFRFLSITILTTAFLSAFLVGRIKQKLQKLSISFALIVALGFSALPYIKPSDFFDRREGFYATNMGTTTVQNEYMPKWVKERPTGKFKEKVELVEGVGKVENVSYNSKKIVFNVNAQEKAKVRVNTIYYPGWNAVVKNRSVAISYSNDKGVMEIEVPKGDNVVELKFSETPLRILANFVSTIFIFLVLFSGSYLKRYNTV